MLNIRHEFQKTLNPLIKNIFGK